MYSGKIVKSDLVFTEREYEIEYEDGKIIKSIRYSPHDKTLEVGDRVKFDIVDGKADIIDDLLVKIVPFKNKDYLLFLIPITVVALYLYAFFFNKTATKYITIGLLGVLIICGIIVICSYYILHKEGDIEEVQIIKKEIIHTPSDNHGAKHNYRYRVTIRRSDGKEITDSINWNRTYQNMNKGDKVKALVNEKRFVLMSEEDLNDYLKKRN